MLAGERFSDHPESVCPAIGSFLRAYNDSIDDVRRQDLYAYAAHVVGSRCTGEIERARTDRLLKWAAEHQRPRRLLPPRLRSLASQRRPAAEVAGTHAAHSIRKHSQETHAGALALLDELLAMGAGESTASSDAPPATERTLASTA